MNGGGTFRVLPSMVLFSVIVLAGFASVILAWRASAGTLAVGLQVPALISGGLAGVALVLVGSALLFVQTSRHLAAQEREQLDHLLDAAAELVNRKES